MVEAKARTYGFELSGLSYITIQGINFFSCSINTSSTSTHDTINGIQALYVSHFEQASATETLWTPHMEDTGIIIRGSNNILENSEIGFSAGNGVLLEGNNTSLEHRERGHEQRDPRRGLHGLDCAGINYRQRSPTVATGRRTHDLHLQHDQLQHDLQQRPQPDSHSATWLRLRRPQRPVQLHVADLGRRRMTPPTEPAGSSTGDPDTVIAYNLHARMTHGPTASASTSTTIPRNYVVDHNLVYDCDYVHDPQCPKRATTWFTTTR